jgi:hypothetical protein
MEQIASEQESKVFSVGGGGGSCMRCFMSVFFIPFFHIPYGFFCHALDNWIAHHGSWNVSNGPDFLDTSFMHFYPPSILNKLVVDGRTQGKNSKV